MAHSILDRAAGAVIRAIHGEGIARNASYAMDEVWTKLTLLFDKMTGVPSRASYVALDEDDRRDGRPRIHIARKFRKKFILPRRRLERRRQDGALQWKRLAPGENTAKSRRYHECDVPLVALTEFGEGWLLYFWTLKLVGLVSFLCMIVMIASWQDVRRRNGPPSDQETHGVLNWLLSRLGSAECDGVSMACLDAECGLRAEKHECPPPSPTNAIPCITVQAIFALYIVSLRRSHSGTAQYVKNLQGDDGLRAEDYAVMVENPPLDGSDPDDWKKHFEQFGEVASVTVAKADGALVWKCLEPRQLTLLLYRDDPVASSKDIVVIDDASQQGQFNPKSRSSSVHSARSFSIATDGDVIIKKSAVDSKQGNEDVDVGDEDADGGAGDTLERLAPWYTGEHLRTKKSMAQLADELEVEPKDGVLDNDKQVRLKSLRNPFTRYSNPYLIFRWIRFELKTALPHYFGTLTKVDRDMVAYRLLRECPKELRDELRELEGGKEFPPVRVFVIFESLAARRDCLKQLTNGGILPTYFRPSRSDLPPGLKFRGERALVVTEPPAPEQMIWWNLFASPWQRFQDDLKSVFVTSVLIIIALYTAILFSSHAVDDNDGPQYFRSFLFACWAQIYNQICTQTFGWLSSQEHHHDLDAQQLSLLLRYTLLKCVTTISYILTCPREDLLALRTVVGMKTMLWGDAVVGPLLRYLDPFDGMRRSLARFLPNQVLMNWAHLSPAHDIADSYSNVVKTLFVGLFVLPVIPSSLLLTAVGCSLTYWVDKQSLLRVWSCHTHSKPAKWVAWGFQYLLAIALVVCMLETLQMYKNWPFDNLCRRTDVRIHNDTLGSAHVWEQCEAPTSYVAIVNDFLSVWVTTPRSYVDADHERALRIYSIGSIAIMIFLFIFFLGRNTWNLSHHLFYANVIDPKENEENLPKFSEFKEATAYLPQVRDPSFMFPLLATDLSTVKLDHIPWVCAFNSMNLAEDIGEEAKMKGLAKRFSVTKHYGQTGDDEDEAELQSGY